MFLKIQIETERFWLKYFVGVKTSLPFFKTAWLKQSKSGKLCVCVRTHECEGSCGIKTNGNLQALTLCFWFFLFCFVFITCLLCHWIPSISGPLLIYIFIIYTSVFTRCLLTVGQTANAGSYRNSISRIHAWGMSSISEIKSLRYLPPSLPQQKTQRQLEDWPDNICWEKSHC